MMLGIELIRLKVKVEGFWTHVEGLVLDINEYEQTIVKMRIWVSCNICDRKIMVFVSNNSSFYYTVWMRSSVDTGVVRVHGILSRKDFSKCLLQKWGYNFVNDK